MSEINYISVRSLPNTLFGRIFATNQAKQKARGGYIRAFNDVLPGLNSNDPNYIRFLIQLYDEVATSGLPTDVSRLRSLSGWKGSPAGHTMVDNTRYREEIMNLSHDSFESLSHREIFDDLVTLMFSNPILGSLRIPSKSSQGLPTLATDRDVKIKAVDAAIREDYEVIISNVLAGDGEALLSRGIVAAYVQNFRTSADRFGKVRKVPDLEFAISGGKNGNLVEIDYHDGISDDRVQACRPRRVMGMHNVLNSMIGVFIGSCENYYLSEYSFTFKHGNYAQMTEKLHSSNYEQIVGVDVGAFDLSVPRWMFTRFFECLKNIGLNESYVDFMEKLHFAPVFEPENGDGLGAGFVGNPLEIQQLYSPGLLSGIRTVSSLGKLFNVFNLLVLCEKANIYHHSKDSLHSVLKGRGEFKMWNAGDDCLLFFNTEQQSYAFREQMSKNQGYFKVEEENPIKFLGGFYDEDSNGVGRFLPDLGSFLINTFVPERPYTSRLREFWPIGVLDRQVIYGSNPNFKNLMSILDNVFEKNFKDLGPFRIYANKIINEYLEKNPLAGSFSDADKSFLLNPESIHYKLDANSVSEDVLALEFNHISEEAQEAFLSFILNHKA